MALDFIHDGHPAYVLGDDGRWRRVDAPLREVFSYGYQRAMVGSTSLSPDATKLAVPQRDGLMVVDLTTGGSRRCEVRGAGSWVSWESARDVLVMVGGRYRSVDVETCRVGPSDHDYATRVLPGGATLTWGGGGGNDVYRDAALHWGDGRTVDAPVNASAGFTPPLVRGRVAVGVHRAKEAMAAPYFGTGDPDLDALLQKSNAVVAVDPSTGVLLGVLALSENKVEYTSLLGWAGGLPVLALVDIETSIHRSYVATWDYRTGVLHPLAVVPTMDVAWGTGL